MNGFRRDARDFGNWISGFTDGEGCFVFAPRWIEKRGRKYFKLIHSFTINLRGDDKEILQDIQRYFGCGNVNFTPAKGKLNPKVRFDVTKLEDLIQIVIPHFEMYKLRAKKKRDFQVWAKAVRDAYKVFLKKRSPTGFKNGWGTWNDSEISKMVIHAEKLKALRKYEQNFRIRIKNS